MKKFITNYMFDLILQLAIVYGAVILLLYSGIFGGMNWLQSISFIIGLRVLVYYFINK